MKQISLIIMCLLLLPVAVYADIQAVIIEEHFGVEGYRTLEFEDGRYYEQINGSREKLDEDLKNISPVLQLQFKPTSNVYITPRAIDGVIEDIPYNYFSNLESSSEYVYSMLHDGFLIKSYSATSRVISIEMERGDILCRVLVYENYLKVYMPEGGF